MDMILVRLGDHAHIGGHLGYRAVQNHALLLFNGHLSNTFAIFVYDGLFPMGTNFAPLIADLF